MYEQIQTKKERSQVSEPTMCVNQVFESLLNSVKSSNLNFHIQQTPFSAVISIKKSKIKDKFNLQPLPLNSKMFASLKAENQGLLDRVAYLENYTTSIQRELEEAVNENETAHKTTEKLEQTLSILGDKLVEAVRDADEKTKVIETLNFVIKDLEKNIGESNIYSEKLQEQNMKMSNQVLELQKALIEKEKALTKISVKKENLERDAQKLRQENEDLLSKVIHCESKLSELESEVNELLPSRLTSTSTSSSASQCDLGDIARNDDCPHLACFVRQPSNPPVKDSKSVYVSPPANIRLLPTDVSSYQDYRSLQISHECEECAEGALFQNYYEMVHYPNSGPGGGTYGSPVTTCPNNPNASISIQKTDVKRKNLRRNIPCKLCEKTFLMKDNLLFHMKRMHMKRR